MSAVRQPDEVVDRDGHRGRHHQQQRQRAGRGAMRVLQLPSRVHEDASAHPAELVVWGIVGRGFELRRRPLGRRRRQSRVLIPGSQLNYQPRRLRGVATQFAVDPPRVGLRGRDARDRRLHPRRIASSAHRTGPPGGGRRRGKTMTDLACLALQLRHRGGRAPGCGHLPEPAPRVREDDLALVAPAGSKDGRRRDRPLKIGLAEFDDGSSTDGNFPQRASGVEACAWCRGPRVA